MSFYIQFPPLLLYSVCLSMTYDKYLAERVSNVLPQGPVLSERRMFGSLAFLYQNNMICAVMEDGLLARVGPKFYKEALTKEYTSEMDFTGRIMKNIVLVSIDGLEDNESLHFWISKCLDFVKTLPAKEKKEPKKKKSKKKTVL